MSNKQDLIEEICRELAKPGIEWRYSDYTKNVISCSIRELFVEVSNKVSGLLIEVSGLGQQLEFTVSHRHEGIVSIFDHLHQKEIEEAAARQAEKESKEVAALTNFLSNLKAQTPTA